MMIKTIFLAIISNAPASRRHFELKDIDLEKYFDPIILSREVEIEKPHAAKNLNFGDCILFNFDRVAQDEFISINDFKKLKEIF